MNQKFLFLNKYNGYDFIGLGVFFKKNLDCYKLDIHDYIICLMELNKNKLKVDMSQQDC